MENRAEIIVSALSNKITLLDYYNELKSIIFYFSFETDMHTTLNTLMLCMKQDEECQYIISILSNTYNLNPSYNTDYCILNTV